jgi:hypothetical protein
MCKLEDKLVQIIMHEVNLDTMFIQWSHAWIRHLGIDLSVESMGFSFGQHHVRFVADKMAYWSSFFISFHHSTCTFHSSLMCVIRLTMQHTITSMVVVLQL